MKKRAIIHVENTEGLIDFAKFLIDSDWTLLSANKTEEFLRKEKIPVLREQALVENNIFLNDTSKLIQTILNTRYPNQEHSGPYNLERDDGIFILCLNFYPTMSFSINQNNSQKIKAVTKPSNYYISTLLRNAFINYENILLLTDPADYKEAITQIRTDNISNSFRLYLASKALNLIAAYDSGLSDTFLMPSHLKGDFLNYLIFPYKKYQALHNGANQHQEACLYKFPYDDGLMTGLQKLAAKDLSYNLITDASVAWEEICMMYSNLKNQSTVKTTNSDGYSFTTQFTPQTGTVFTIAVKYKQIIGASFASNVIASFNNTYTGENREIDNVTISCSSVIDEAAAKEMINYPLAAIIAPGFTPKAKELFYEKKSIKLISVSNVNCSEYSIVLINGGVLFQTNDSVIFSHWNIKTKKRPSQEMADQMIFGMMIAMQTRTHTAMLIRDFSIISIAQGCKSEKRALEQVIYDIKRTASADSAENNIQADLLVCDTAFSLNDSVKELIDGGLSAIIQTGGKADDQELINYCEQHDVTLIFTGTSHISY